MAKNLLDVVAAKGIRQADVLITTGNSDSIEMKRNAIDFSRTRTPESKAFLRCHHRGGMSRLSTNLQSTTPERFASMAASLAKLSQPDPDFVSLPTATPPASPVRGCYDRSIASLTPDDLMDMAVRAIDTARTGEDHVIQGSVGRQVSNCYYLSCFGTEFSLTTTSVSVGVSARVERDGEMAIFYDGDAGRRLADLHLERVARRAGEKAPTYLGAKTVKTGDLPIVIDPHVGVSILPTILATGAIAESVQRRRSYFCGMLDKEVAVPEISMVDNGRVPWGLGSSTFDGEGFPHRKLWVVRKGVLESLFHNTYTANKEGIETTGHADMGYPLSISPTNLVIPPGEWELEEMIQGVKEGIFVEEGGFQPDPATGDISTSLDFAFKIENGELAYPLKNTLIGINALEMLKQIDAVSKDTHEYPGTSAPGFRVPSAKISGGA
jgi:PmbA protein